MKAFFKNSAIWVGVIVLISLFVALIYYTSPGPNTQEERKGNVYAAGFWSGLWHGIIFPFSFVLSIFTKNVRFFEVYNNGFWYNFGFFLALILMIRSTASGNVKQ